MRCLINVIDSVTGEVESLIYVKPIFLKDIIFDFKIQYNIAQVFVNAQPVNYLNFRKLRDKDIVDLYLAPTGDSVGSVLSWIGGGLLMAVGLFTSNALLVAAGAALISFGLSSSEQKQAQTSSLGAAPEQKQGASLQALSSTTLSANNYGKIQLVLGAPNSTPSLINQPYYTCKQDTNQVYYHLMVALGYKSDLDTVKPEDIHVIGKPLSEIRDTQFDVTQDYVVPSSKNVSITPLREEDAQEVSVLSYYPYIDRIKNVKVLLAFNNGFQVRTPSGGYASTTIAINYTVRNTITGDSRDLVLDINRNGAVFDAFYHEIDIPLGGITTTTYAPVKPSLSDYPLGQPVPGPYFPGFNDNYTGYYNGSYDEPDKLRVRYNYRIVYDDTGSTVGWNDQYRYYTPYPRPDDALTYTVNQETLETTVTRDLGIDRFNEIEITKATILNHVDTNQYIVSFSINQIAWYLDKTLCTDNDIYTYGITYGNPIAIDESNLKVSWNLRAKYRDVLTREVIIEPDGKGNPINAILYLATSKNVLGKSIFSDERLDWESFEEAYKYCKARNYTYNLTINDGRRFDMLINEIALTANCRIYFTKEGKLGILIDDYYDENYDSIKKIARKAYSSVNTMKDSWSVANESLDDLVNPTVFRVYFLDRATNMQATSYIFVDPRRYFYDNMQPKDFNTVLSEIDLEKDIVEEIDMTKYEGVQNPDQIYWMGRREILKRWYYNISASFETDRSGADLKVWDYLRLSHRTLTNASVAGKIADIQNDTIVLDRNTMTAVNATLDDGLFRELKLPNSEVTITFQNEGNPIVSTYTIIEVTADYTLKVDRPITETFTEGDLFSIGSGDLDVVLLNKSTDNEGKYYTMQAVDYVFDASCLPYVNNPYQQYLNATKLKYGNPYYTYLETIPEHYITESESNG